MGRDAFVILMHIIAATGVAILCGKENWREKRFFWDSIGNCVGWSTLACLVQCVWAGIVYLCAGLSEQPEHIHYATNFIWRALSGMGVYAVMSLIITAVIYRRLRRKYYDYYYDPSEIARY